MNKKLKLFSAIFSMIVLFPFNFLTISCGKKENGNRSISNTVAIEETLSDSEEIKADIKDNLYGDRDATILSLEDLQADIDSHIRKNLEEYLEQLSNKLTDTVNNVELDNQVIIQGLKQRIYDNCEKVDKFLKDPERTFADTFKEVTGKVLEIDEDSIIFNLKKFNLKQILDSTDEPDEFDSSQEDDSLSNSEEKDEKIEIYADSAKLKIYNFSVNLNINMNYGNDKKELVKINDYNLFVVLDKEKTSLLTEGISKYLEDKINKKINSTNKNDASYIPIYLNGQPDRKTNNYFTEIIKKSNYNLTDQKNISEIAHYLANIYLAEKIFKNNDNENEVKIITKKVEINENSENKTIKGESGKNLTELKLKDKEEISFLKLFGKNGNMQISKETIDNNIVVENFLENTEKVENNYYLLGKGSVNVNRWTIKGFSLNPIKLNFKIFIKDHILSQQIEDLRTCLEELLRVTADSKVVKRNNLAGLVPPVDSTTEYKEKYTVNIEVPKKYLKDATVANALPKGKSWAEIDTILNALYIERTKKNLSNGVFSDDSVDYKFTTKTSTNKDSLHFKSNSKNNGDYYSDSDASVLDKPINIYFVFNSFRINLTNDSLFKRRRIAEVIKTRNNKQVSIKEDGNKLWFR